MKKFCVIFLVFAVCIINLFSQSPVEEIFFEPDRIPINGLDVYSENAAIAVGKSGLIRVLTNSAKTIVNYYTEERKDLSDVVYIDEMNLIAVGDKGLIYKSVDGGYNWSKVNSGLNEKLNSVVFTGNLTGFAAGDNGVICKTTNGGTSWEKLNSNISKNLKMITSSNHKILFAAGDDGMVIKTIDEGNTWNIVNVPSNVNFQHIKAIGDSKIYLMGDSLTVLISNDLGQNWNSPTLEPDYDELYVRPEITSFFFFNELEGVIKVVDDYADLPRSYDYFTSDGGISWTSYDLFSSFFGSPPYNTQNMSFSSKEFGILITEHSVIYTAKYTPPQMSTKYIKLNYTYRFKTVKSKDSQVGAVYEYGEPIEMLVSSDSGKSWSLTKTFDTIGKKRGVIYFADMNMPKKDRIIIAMNNEKDTTIINGDTSKTFYINLGYILQSDDFGQNWTEFVIPKMEPENVISSQLQAKEIDMYSEDYGLLRLGSKTNYMFTEDGGKTWDYIPIHDSAQIKSINAVYCISPDIHLLVAVTLEDKYVVYKTKNGGTTWENKVYIPKDFKFIKYFDENNMLAFGYVWDTIPKMFINKVTKTTDGGQNWDEIYSDESSFYDGFILGYVEFDNDNIILRGDHIIYKTNDGGKTWEKINLEILIKSREKVTAITCINNKEFIFVTDYSRMFKFTGDNSVSVTEITSNKSNLLVYPNPVHDFLNIRTDNPSTNPVIKIYNIQGFKILESEFVETLNLHFLKSGTYIIVVGDSAQKFIKM